MTQQADEARLKEMVARVGAIREMHIPHRQLLDVKADLRTLVDRDNATSEGACMPLVGKSGSGKTKLILDFMSEYPRRKHALVNERGEKADHTPVLLVSVPDAGEKPLMERLYKAASGASVVDTRRRFDFREEAARLLGQMQTRVVIFEETHQAFGPKPESVARVATAFKDLLNDAKFTIVLAGTSEVFRLFEASPELARRKLDNLTLDPFSWNEPTERSVPEFFRVLKAFDDALEAALGSRSGLDAPGLALRLHIATGGLIGLLAVLLERAGTLAARDIVRRKATQITTKHLARTFAGQRAPGTPNPFVIDEDDAVRAMARAQHAAEAPAVPPAAVIRARGRRRHANPDHLFRP